MIVQSEQMEPCVVAQQHSLKSYPVYPRLGMCVMVEVRMKTQEGKWLKMGSDQVQRITAESHPSVELMLLFTAKYASSHVT